MTRIDFYVLAEADEESRSHFCCRLADRARQQGHAIYVHTSDAAAAQRIDALLWDYPRHAFVPHGLAGSSAAAGATVVIGHGNDPVDHDDVLINLSDAVPEFFTRFARIAEIVIQAPAARAGGRDRFRFYRERGYPLHHHDMKDWSDE